MPRPLPPGGKRTIALQVFVNDPEWTELETAALERDMTYADYVRCKVFGRRLPPVIK